MKRTLLMIGLGVAFLSVSGWVWLCRGRSAKALRAKYKLGGLLLTLAGVASTTGCITTCYDPAETQTTCYDPVPKPEIFGNASLSTEKALTVRNGDEISFMAENVSRLAVLLLTPEGEELQRIALDVDWDTLLTITIEVGDYRGLAMLDFYTCVEEKDKTIQLLDRINELPYLLSIVE